MGNLLLDALPRELYRSLQADFERLSLKRGQVLHEPGHRIRHLHFPLTCVVSISMTTAEGRTAETGVAGNREMIGVNAFMGGAETTQTRYVVQIPGEALRIPARPLLDIAQISQNALPSRPSGPGPLCPLAPRAVRAHAVHGSAPYARVRRRDARRTRASVTETSLEFEREGLIRVGRGTVHLTHESRLEQAACECYGALRDEYDRLLGRRPEPVGRMAD